MKVFIIFLLSCMLLACKEHSKRQVLFRAKQVWSDHMGTKRVSQDVYIVWFDSAYHVGDTVDAGPWNTFSYILLERVR